MAVVAAVETGAPTEIQRVGATVDIAPFRLPDVSVAQLNPERVVAHERGPVLVDLSFEEPTNLYGEGREVNNQFEVISSTNRRHEG